MAEKEIKIVVTGDSTSAVEAANKATASQEALTNTGKGLASAFLSWKRPPNNMSSALRREYVAIQKAHEAISAKIPVLEAAGKSTVKYIEAQQNLSEALSTNQALLIAEKIENRAAAEAALESRRRQGGRRSRRIKQHGDARADGYCPRTETGNFSKLPGSTSILAREFDLMKFTPAASAFPSLVCAAAYFLYEHLKTVNEELDKTAADLNKL